jgi:hypothetical protein
VLELPVGPEQAIGALRRAVEEWGGGFGDDAEALDFAVPIRAGIRQGYARMRPVVQRGPLGSRLHLEVLDQALHVNRSAFVILLMGALGGVAAMLWPLLAMVSPPHEDDSLLGVAAIGAVLALLAWLMVASRARSAGPEELLQTVAEIVEDDATGGAPGRS